MFKYILDDRGSIPAKEKRIFFYPFCLGRLWGLLRYLVGSEDPFPEGKARQGRDTDLWTRLAPKSRKIRNCTSSPLKHLHGV
jgi:hypothetical protein